MALQNLLRTGTVITAVATCSLLAGCTGQVTADLATDVPADRDIDQVNVTLTGLEFRKDDGTAKTLTFRDGQPVNLMDYLISFDRTPLRVFTNEALPNGTYTGVRLAFDTDPADDDEVVDVGGDSTPLVLADGNYADFDLSVDDNKSSSESVTLTLDLRQSLSLNDAGDEYTLQPYLRSVSTRDAGEIVGSVVVTCPVSQPLAEGGAVYLFAGKNVEPDDRDNAGVEPVATTEIYPTQTAGQFAYQLRNVPEGDYTIAMTCRGDEEDPTTSEDLEFRLIDNIQLDRAQTLRHDFGG